MSDAYVSCTVDEGKFFLYDQRTQIRKASFSIDLQHQDLYTHERYNDFNVLLGFGDGSFKHIDMRQSNKMSAHNSCDCVASQCSVVLKHCCHTMN